MGDHHIFPPFTLNPSSSTTQPVISTRSNVYLVQTYVIVSTGVLMNLIALVLLTHRACKKQNDIPLTLMLMLTTADFVSLIIYTITHAVSAMLKSYNITLYCNVFGITNLLLPLISAIIAMLMSIERFIAICLPFQYRDQRRKTLRVFLMFTTMALLVIFISILPLLGVGSYNPSEFLDNTTYCKLFWKPNEPVTDTIHFSFYYSSAVLIVSVVLFCNVGVILRLVKRNREIAVISPPRNSTVKRQEKQYAWMVLGITSLYTICWFPWIMAIGALRMGIKAGFQISIIATLFLLANHTLDPVVFLISYVIHWTHLRRHLCRKPSTTASNEPPS